MLSSDLYKQKNESIARHRRYSHSYRYIIYYTVTPYVFWALLLAVWGFIAHLWRWSVAHLPTWKIP